MRIQWNLILGLIFALIVAFFAVVNVDPVSVNYLFGHTQLPLIIVIIGSALLGGLVVGMFGILRQYKLHRNVKRLEKELNEQSREDQFVEPNNEEKDKIENEE